MVPSDNLLIRKPQMLRVYKHYHVGSVIFEGLNFCGLGN